MGKTDTDRLTAARGQMHSVSDSMHSTPSQLREPVQANVKLTTEVVYYHLYHTLRDISNNLIWLRIAIALVLGGCVGLGLYSPTIVGAMAPYAPTFVGVLIVLFGLLTLLGILLLLVGIYSELERDACALRAEMDLVSGDASYKSYRAGLLATKPRPSWVEAKKAQRND